ncbi:hypothetical protein CHS0354_007504 [Potamilus streckersoni]|uniref:Cilia- and flagella-associated protein 97 n=1 Tax=Potamilus streckersoni TaxID=2493646 RepID=A0AAE0T910_9BIVA|nr:hypothetical protein CHS0354_007504 [Potamilus streckersoni]
MEIDENIDFDFFESPRKKQQTSNAKHIVKDNLHGNRNSFERPQTAILSKQNDRNEPQKIRSEERNSSSGSDHYSDTFDSDTNSDGSHPGAGKEISTKRMNKNKRTHKSEQFEEIINQKRKEDRKRGEGEYDRRSSSYSDSSSAYSDGSSHEDNSDKKSKKTVNVRVPKVYMEAWGAEKSTVTFEPPKHSDRKRKEENNIHKERDQHRGGHSERDSIDLESHARSRFSPDRSRHTEHKKHMNTRKGRPLSGHHRKVQTLPRRNSLSDSNNSDITEVSPLVTPQSTPRAQSSSDIYGKHVKTDQQYKIPEDDSVGTNIKLDSDKIDLNVLMQCMAEIDYEKQQRLKANTRRVMFAPARPNDRPRSNYSFPADRVKLIEQENQRLLNEILKNDPRQNSKPKAKQKTKQIPVPPQRLTPSAVNRQREQRKIEMQNLQFLKRLHGIKASKGMAREEQLKEFEETMHYGVPLGAALPIKTETLYRPGNTSSTTNSVYGSGGKRSRPSSAKSNASVTSIRSSVRSRPSSAKSNVSVISKRSKGSRPGSAKSTKSLDIRPPWDDRFSCA